MIKKTLLTLSPGSTYASIQQSIELLDDFLHLSPWTFTYPLRLYSHDLSEIHEISKNAVKIKKANLSVFSNDQKWQYLVITRENGTRLYCISLRFYLVIIAQRRQFLGNNQSNLCSSGHKYQILPYYVPVCLVLYSQKEYFKLMTNLIRIFRQLRKTNLLFQESTQRQAQIFQMLDYYLKCANSPFTGQKIYVNPAQNNLQLLHLYHYSDSIYNIGYFMHLPIAGETLAKAICAILSQKQIIFVSNNCNSNVMLISTLLQMLLPLKWDFMYVPNLPEQFIDAVNQSFLPFIVGINYKLLNYVQNLNDKVVVYTDQNVIRQSDKQDNLPSHLRELLVGVRGYNSYAGSYLSWQKEIRIKSLLLVARLLDLSHRYHTKKQREPINRKKDHSPSLSKKNSPHHRASVSLLNSESNHFSEKGNIRFIEHFSSFSSFYERYRQGTRDNRLDDPYKSYYFSKKIKEMEELLEINDHLRCSFLQIGFKIVETAAKNPSLCNDNLEWKKYKESLSRHSESISHPRELYKKQKQNYAFQNPQDTSSSIDLSFSKNVRKKIDRASLSKKNVKILTTESKIIDTNSSYCLTESVKSHQQIPVCTTLSQMKPNDETDGDKSYKYHMLSSKRSSKSVKIIQTKPEMDKTSGMRPTFNTINDSSIRNRHMTMNLSNHPKTNNLNGIKNMVNYDYDYKSQKILYFSGSTKSSISKMKKNPQLPTSEKIKKLIPYIVVHKN